jgi:YihY family inner membrane protein
MKPRNSIYLLAIRFWKFLLQVLHSFIRNQGLLLSGAVAYHTLLSIIPLSILALVVLSHFIEKEPLIQTLSTYLQLVIPGFAATLTEQVREFLQYRKVVGIIGFVVMLFFSSIAFSMLENAMSVIFSQRKAIKRRNFLASAVIPYVYILAIGLGIVLVSFVEGAIETVGDRGLVIFGWSLNLEKATRASLYVLGILGEVVMLVSFYLVMPKTHVRFRHAFIGGITAAILWELVRRVLVWYYSVLSMVNVIYGSIAITVVALLIIEVGALIILLGAQVIAELEYHGEPTAEGKSGVEA